MLLRICLLFLLVSCNPMTKVKQLLAGKRQSFQLAKVIGQGSIHNGGEEYEAEVGNLLEESDVITTDKYASLIFNFGAGSELKVGRRSLTRVLRLYDKQKLQRDTFELKRGSLFVHFKGGLADNDVLQIKYADHQILANETSAFLVAIDQNTLDMRIVLLEGKILVKAFGKLLPVKIGEGLLMGKNGRIEKPAYKRWVRAVKWSEVVQGTSLEGKLKTKVTKLQSIWEQAMGVADSPVSKPAQAAKSIQAKLVEKVRALKGKPDAKKAAKKKTKPNKLHVGQNLQQMHKKVQTLNNKTQDLKKALDQIDSD